MSRTERRLLAVALALLTVGSVFAVTAVGLTVTPTSGTGELDADGGPRLSHAHAAADPALSGHGQVVHLTSHDEPTSDYALSVVDVRDVRLNAINTLEFDYYEGGDNADAAPDEVWLVLENDTGRHVVFQRFDDGTVFGAERWRTQSVVAALTDADRPWTEVDAAEDVSDPRAVLEDLSDEDLTKVGTDLVARYGKGTRVLAVGVGRGDPLGGPTVVDLYYDDLQVNGKTYQFPVASVNVKPDPLDASTDVVNATIDLGGFWAGNTVHDINASTVRLNGTAPIEGSATLDDFDGDGVDELRVQFEKDEVADDLAAGEDVPVTVDGVFDDDATAFAATDHVDVE